MLEVTLHLDQARALRLLHEQAEALWFDWPQQVGIPDQREALGPTNALLPSMLLPVRQAAALIAHA